MLNTVVGFAKRMRPPLRAETMLLWSDSSKDFSYNPNSKTFSVEASDLRGRKLGLQFVNESDSPFRDNQISIQSARSKQVATYEIYRTQTDNEGDVLAWHLRPVEASIQRLGAAVAGTSVTIFND
jgi:hypothetical protein